MCQVSILHKSSSTISLQACTVFVTPTNSTTNVTNSQWTMVVCSGHQQQYSSYRRHSKRAFNSSVLYYLVIAILVLVHSGVCSPVTIVQQYSSFNSSVDSATTLGSTQVDTFVSENPSSEYHRLETNATTASPIVPITASQQIVSSTIEWTILDVTTTIATSTALTTTTIDDDGFNRTKRSETDQEIVCQICWCNKANELDCRYRNDQSSAIEHIPIFSNESDRTLIVEIIASNQPYLKRLDRLQISPYVNIKKLIIENSGLEVIEFDTFQDNIHLQKISLKNNRIAILSWRHFDRLNLLDLSIEDNPFECNCAISKWVEHLVNQKKNILGPYWNDVTCVDKIGQRHLLSSLNANYDDCSYPNIKVDPETVTIKEGESIVIKCESTASPIPNIYWDTSTLNSNFTLLEPEQKQVIFDSNGIQSRPPLYRVSQILHIEQAHVDDNENVVCIAENTVGKVTSTVTVNVHSSPKIEVMETEKKFYMGIKFLIKGIPYANTTWYKNGKRLSMSEGNYREYKIKHRAFIEGHLTIHKQTQASNGLYTLTGENQFGHVEKSINVTFNQEMISSATTFPGMRNRQPSHENKMSPPVHSSVLPNESAEIDSEKHDPYEKSSLFRLSNKFLLSCVVIVVLIVFVIIAMMVYKIPFGLKTDRSAVHSSWSSDIDSNHSHKLREHKFPLYSYVCNWINRKKRLIWTRRSRRSVRLANQPTSRAMLYYNGRLLRQTSGQSGLSADPDLETLAALMSAQCNKPPIANLVENPNYFSDSERRLLDNSSIYHISAKKIQFHKKLGEGAFGEVYLGTVDYLTKEERTTLVAIKMLKETLRSCAEQREEFSREAEFLANLVHSNIVTFYGISMDGANLMMIFEYMEYGDLNNFLRERDPVNFVLNKVNNSDESAVTETSFVSTEQSKTLQLIDLLYIATQIATGMEYLASQRFVHRDLATRNCLVGSNLVTKIGDFGMSRDVYATDYYRVGRDVLLPIRWMSPESIMYRKYTVESDCWSFGILLWEVLVYGKQPWFEYSNSEVIQNVTQGKLLSPPENCQPEIYEIMKDCWKFDPSERTPISNILEKLKQLLNTYSQDTIGDKLLDNYEKNRAYSYNSKGEKYLMLSQAKK